MNKWIFILLAALVATSFAHQSNYAGEQTRRIKALSENDIESLREGRGMGLAKVAELNSYPGPMHVLELAGEIKLTAGQNLKIGPIMASMKTRAKELGAKIIASEAALDQQFRTGRPNPKKVAEAMERIGKLQGQLRWAHVKAHIETRAILSKAQVAMYDKLRGYAEAPK